MSASLNTLESDPDEDPSTGSRTITHTELDTYGIPLALGEDQPNKLSFQRWLTERPTNQEEAEKKSCTDLTNKIQTTTISETSASNRLSFRRWLNKKPTNQGEAGETPHTLHERRPPSDIDDLWNSQIDYIQQLERQRESLSKQSRGKGSTGTAKQQEEVELTLPGTKTLSPRTLYEYGEGRRVKRLVQDETTMNTLKKARMKENKWKCILRTTL